MTDQQPQPMPPMNLGMFVNVCPPYPVMWNVRPVQPPPAEDGTTRPPVILFELEHAAGRTMVGLTEEGGFAIARSFAAAAVQLQRMTPPKLIIPDVAVPPGFDPTGSNGRG